MKKATQFAASHLADHVSYALDELHGQILSYEDRLYDMIREPIGEYLALMEWEADLASDIAATVSINVSRAYDGESKGRDYTQGDALDDLFAAMREVGGW
jgi:hypothetical protein